MSKFWKDLAGDHYETLAKALYRRDHGQIVDPSSLYMALLSLPRGLLSWLIKNVKPIPENDTKTFEVPGSGGGIIEIRKTGSDLYRGQFYKNGKMIHSTGEAAITLPELGGHCLNVFDLYEDVAGRPVEDVEKKELAEASKEDKTADTISKLGELIDKILDKKQEIKKEEISPAPAPQAPQPVIVNVTLSNIGNVPKAEDMPKVEEIKKEEMMPADTTSAGTGIMEMKEAEPVEKAKYEAGLPKQHKIDIRQERQDEARKPEQGVHKPVTTNSIRGKSAAGIQAIMGRKERSKQMHSQKLSELKSMPKPDLPKAELDKAKMDEGLSPEAKLESRTARLKSNPSINPRTTVHGKPGMNRPEHSRGINEAISTKGHSLQAAKVARGDLSGAKAAAKEITTELKAMPKPNLPKAELEKAPREEKSHHAKAILNRLKAKNLDKADNQPKFDKTPKSNNMAPQAPTPPMEPQTGNKMPKINGPLNTSAMPKGNNAQASSVKAPSSTLKAPKAPSMKMAVKSISKEEMDSAKSDSGAPLFMKDKSGKYVFNPTGVQAVMTKKSVEIKKNEDDTYAVYVNGKSWDLDNCQLLASMIKLRGSLKKYGF